MQRVKSLIWYSHSNFELEIGLKNLNIIIEGKHSIKNLFDLNLLFSYIQVSFYFLLRTNVGIIMKVLQYKVPKYTENHDHTSSRIQEQINP